VADPVAPQLAEVTVCICTFRRPSVLRTIDSIARQQCRNGPLTLMLVIDNDDEPTAGNLITEFSQTARVAVSYIHAPAKNISIARNAALDAVTTPWLAFIDDDERAAPNWLAKLWAARSGANAIFGLSSAVYPDEAPRWLKEGDYHSNYVLDRNSPVNTGYTSNALIDMEFVRRHALRFDPALGTTGGEDTIFFHQMFRSRGALKYVRDAIVYEDVVPSRLHFGWVAKRRFRVGQIYAMMFYRFSFTDYLTVSVGAPLKITACLIMAAATMWRPSRSMWWLMRSIFHSGALSFALGFNVYEEYRPPGRRC
jgi:succinoglycan biosynthesis protein ExoM